MLDEDRRKKTLVDRGLQFRYSLFNVVLLVVFALLASVTMYTSVRFGLLASQLGEYAEQMLSGVFRNLRSLFLIQALIFIVVAILVAMRISLRIAGPVYHLKRGMKEIAAGNYSARVGFRKKDELKDLGAEFNKMAQVLEEKQRK